MLWAWRAIDNLAGQPRTWDYNIAARTEYSARKPLLQLTPLLLI